MSLPYAVNCTNGQGIRQSHSAEGYIVSPTNRRIGAMCQLCAQECIDEYKDRLGEVWTFERQEWQPVPKKDSLPYSSRLAGLLACSCADLNNGEHPFYSSSISPEGLAIKISEAIQEILIAKEEPQSQSISFYIDPIHSAASTLGKLGGQARSESKSTSSRENGRKGGRPKKQKEIQLDMGDI